MAKSFSVDNDSFTSAERKVFIVSMIVNCLSKVLRLKEQTKQNYQQSNRLSFLYQRPTRRVTIVGLECGDGANCCIVDLPVCWI